MTSHHLRFSDEGRLIRSALAGARRAAKVIVPSGFAGRELHELAGVSETVVIPYGVSDEYLHSTAATDESLDSLGISLPFLIHAAGATQRKNLSGLADAWLRLSETRDDLALVLCGPPDVRRDSAFEGLARVIKTGRLEPRTVASLMRRAEAVIVPSIYEGFGLPALEGMACGTPVVAANRGALPEVCGDAALLVEPDGSSIANGILDLLAHEAVAKDLRGRGRARALQFDWGRAARDHLRVYEDVLG